MTNSKIIADVFDKPHKNVMRDIKSLISDSGEFGSINFVLSSYISRKNKELPCYEMTREGFELLIANYETKVIKYF